MSSFTKSSLNQHPMAAPRVVFTKFMATSAEGAEPPHTLRSLNGIRALGFILNKRKWWEKWTTRSDVRAKWMSEIDTALIHANVAQGLAYWPARPRADEYMSKREHDLIVLQKVEQIWAPFLDACDLDDHAKLRRIDELTKHVWYPTPQEDWDPLRHGKTFEDADIHDDEDFAHETHGMGSGGGISDFFHWRQNGGDVDLNPYNSSFSDKAVECNFLKVYRLHVRKHPFCQKKSAWFLNMMMNLNERLRVMEPEEWTRENLGAILCGAFFLHKNAELTDRTICLIGSMMNIEGEIAVDKITALLPSGLRENVIKLLHLHFLKIYVLLKRQRMKSRGRSRQLSTGSASHRRNQSLQMVVFQGRFLMCG